MEYTCADCHWAFVAEQDEPVCVMCGWHVCQRCRSGHRKVEDGLEGWER